MNELGKNVNGELGQELSQTNDEMKRMSQNLAGQAKLVKTTAESMKVYWCR